jgi:hypothetical protein
MKAQQYRRQYFMLRRKKELEEREQNLPKAANKKGGDE